MLYCCKIKDISENSQLTIEFLNTLEKQYSSWTDKEQNETYHIFYCSTEKEAKQIKHNIEHLHKKEWKNYGIKLPDWKNN